MARHRKRIERAFYRRVAGYLVYRHVLALSLPQRSQEVEARCLKGAAKVVVVTDAVKNLLSEKYGLGIEAKTIVLCYGYARTTKKRGLEPLFRMVYTEQLRGIDIASKTFFKKALRALVQLFYAVCSGLDFVSGFA